LLVALEFPVIRWIGLVSYGLYLWHPIVMRLDGPLWAIPITGRLLDSELARAATHLGLSCAVAAVSFYLWERPFLRLKRYFQPRTARRGSPASPDPSPSSPAERG